MYIYANLKGCVRLFIDYANDYLRFSRHNLMVNTVDDKIKLSSLITKITHGIEKAFSLPEVRLGYGVESCKKLIILVHRYLGDYGVSDVVKNACCVLKYYKEYHEHYDYEFDYEVENGIKNIIKTCGIEDGSCEGFGGVKKIKKSDILDIVSRFDYKQFAESRNSVRDLYRQYLSDEDIEQIVDIAMKTPSACNRRAWRVNVYRGDAMNRLLDIQNGNSGFRDNIEQVILVVGVLSSFTNLERNQVYVDGGLFAMSLLYSIHSCGYGACALNTAVSLGNEKQFRDIAKIYPFEVPIMMIAIGGLKEEYKVALSVRVDCETIIRTICT